MDKNHAWGAIAGHNAFMDRVVNKLDQDLARQREAARTGRTIDVKGPIPLPMTVLPNGTRMWTVR